MVKVGIRELKARLSAYVRQVRRGTSVAGTDRGAVVAELHQPRAAAVSAAARRYREALAAGWLREPTDPRDRSWLKGPGIGLPRGTAAALLDAERADR